MKYIRVEVTDQSGSVYFSVFAPTQIALNALAAFIPTWDTRKGFPKIAIT